MVLRKFQRDLRYFQGCFKEGNTMKISKVFNKVPSCFKEVSSVFQLCLKSDSGKIEKKLFKQVSKGLI